MFEVVDLEQIGHQPLRRRTHRLEAPVERLPRELDRTVDGALVVAGQDGAQVQHGAVTHLHRNRRDERGETLAGRAHQPVHQTGDLEHRRERLATTDPPVQRFGRDDGGGPGRVTQQGDLTDDQAGSELDDGVVPVGAGVAHLGPARSDQQEGHRELTLLHQHLSRRGGQRA